MDAAKFDAWAIIDLFGHVRIAGRVTEESIGGCHFLRCDVPEVNGRQGFTRYLTQGAIYSMTLVDETIARAFAHQHQIRPVSVYDVASFKVDEVRNRLLPRDD